MGIEFRLSASTQGGIASTIPTRACVSGAHTLKDIVGGSPESARSTEASEVYPGERWHSLTRRNTDSRNPEVRMDGTWW